MKRGSEELVEIPGQDSFLDVITNIVGILILLVLIVGIKTGRSVASTAMDSDPILSQPPAVSKERIIEARKSASSRQREVSDIARRVVDVRSALEMREQERTFLTTFVAAAERDVNDRRQELSTDQQRDFDIRRQLIDAQQTLDDLGREQVSLLAQEPETEVVQSLPTPLAKTVSGQEVHLRLAYGQVSVVPFDELEKELESNLERNVWRLREQGAMDGTVGPIGGYRLRYRIQMTQVSVPTRSGMDQMHMVPKYRVDFLPVSPRMGEPVDQAVLPTSDLRRVLKKFSPANTTVTIWTYPDSFKEFRLLKKSLFDLGYSAAGRPLPEGMQIGGSPTGTKSAAQ